jgi:hypothetical protein
MTMSDYSNLPTNPAVMCLAHPIRVDTVMPTMFDDMKALLGPDEWPQMEAAMKTEGTLTNILLRELTTNRRNYRLNEYIGFVGGTKSSTGLGNIYPSMLYFRHRISSQPYFVIDDALVELLEFTDISDDVPLSMLVLPYSRFYIELGKKRISTAVVPSITTGMHILEGAYFERGHSPDYGDVINVVLTGSPLGKAHALDDSTSMIYLPLRDADKPLRDVVRESLMRGNEAARMSGLRVTPTEFIDTGTEALLLLMKSLLYISLPETRRILKKERTEHEKVVAGLQSKAKKQKAERRGRHLVDYVLITAPAEPAGSPAYSARNERAPIASHWRRGHVRRQRFGEKYSQERLVFIRPTLVSGQGPEEARTPEYQVR